MQAMVFEGEKTLRMREIPIPSPKAGQVLLKVEACGVCRTDLHIVDGELAAPKRPLVPGHQVVGIVADASRQSLFRAGDRIGVPWLAWTCGKCKYCNSGKENLCENALFTGYTVDGGFAEYAVAYADFCYPVPHLYGPSEAAPLFCGGLIGYRAYRKAGPHIQHLGLYGFGSAAHLLTQLAIHEGKQVYAFTRDGDTKSQDFARKLGCQWAGNASEKPPRPLDAAIIFAPVGPLVTLALKAVDKGGTVVCGGIHMSDIPSFPYADLWEERTITAVANLERIDGREYLPKAAAAGVRPNVKVYRLEEANNALEDLRAGNFEGSAVIMP